jgi:hypothetical protein
MGRRQTTTACGSPRSGGGTGGARVVAGDGGVEEEDGGWEKPSPDFVDRWLGLRVVATRRGEDDDPVGRLQWQ